MTEYTQSEMQQAKFDLRQAPGRTTLDLQLALNRTMQELNSLTSPKERKMMKLTEREGEIVCCVMLGMNTPLIGKTLRINADTVRTHLSHIFTKTGMSNKVELVGWAMKYGGLQG